jgi:hypothetical protein
VRGAGVPAAAVDLADHKPGAEGSGLWDTTCDDGYERKDQTGAHAKTSGFH